MLQRNLEVVLKLPRTISVINSDVAVRIVCGVQHMTDENKSFAVTLVDRRLKHYVKDAEELLLKSICTYELKYGFRQRLMASQGSPAT